MDLDTNVVHRAFCASDQLRRHLGPAFQAKHLFDLDPVHGHGLDRQAKGFASGRQRHLGETCRGHDRLAMHLVIRQPGDELGSDIRLPHMIAAGRHFNVHPQ